MYKNLSILSIFYMIILHISLQSENFSHNEELPLGGLEQESIKNNIKFSSDERLYLKNKGIINICIRGNFLPYEKLEKDSHIGITSEYMKIFEDKIQIPMKLIKTKNWQDLLSKIKNRECDITPLILKKEEKYKKFLKTTDSYINCHLVIATKMDTSYIHNINKLEDKKFIYTSNSKEFVSSLKILYPNIKLQKAKNRDEAIEKVLKSEVYGYIDNYYTLAYFIKNKYFNQLKISGKIDEIEFNGAIGVRSDETILLDIFNKNISFLNTKIKKKIEDNWISVKYETSIKVKYLQEILLFILAFSLFLIYREYKDRKFKNYLKVKNKELKESVDNFKTLLNILNEAVILFDEDFKCIDANRVAVVIFGYSNEEFVDKTFFEFVVDSSPLTAQNILNKKNNISYQLQLYKKDNTKFWAQIKSNEIYQNGKKIKVITMFDMTKMKKTQEELERLNKNLEIEVAKEVKKNLEKDKMIHQQFKMIAMGEIIGNIAHQWRQPINTLNINLEMLEYDYQDGLIDKEFIQDFVLRNTKIIYDLSKTIDNFKHFYQSPTQKILFTIRDMAEEVLKITTLILSSNFIKLEITGEDALINGYPNELKQVFINLINNSKDSLILSMKEKKITEGKIILDIQECVDGSMITISDNGRGVDLNIKNKIFEPYSTTKFQSQGTGLGLYMSKMIIEQNMKGKLELLDSQIGAKFMIKLPKG